MINKRVSAIKILHSDRLIDQTVIIVAFNDLSVHMLKYQTSEYLFDSISEVDQIFGCFEHGQLTVALIQNHFSKENENLNQTLKVNLHFCTLYYTHTHTCKHIYLYTYILFFIRFGQI